MRNLNLNLKLVIFKSGLSQRDIARNTGIPESIISMGVRGMYNFDEMQKAAIAKFLNKPVEELFVNK